MHYWLVSDLSESFWNTQKKNKTKKQKKNKNTQSIARVLVYDGLQMSFQDVTDIFPNSESFFATWTF